MKNIRMMDGGENILIKPGIAQGKNSCEAKCEIGIDDDGLWYAKWTCPNNQHNEMEKKHD
jgi:hypothetical protein